MALTRVCLPRSVKIRGRLLPRLMVTGSLDCGPKVQGSALAHNIILQRYEAVFQSVWMST